MNILHMKYALKAAKVCFPPPAGEFYVFADVLGQIERLQQETTRSDAAAESDA